MPILGTQSSINVTGYGFGGTAISAEATVTPTNLIEGTQITVTVTTDGVSDGTTLYYTISGTLGTITASDFTDNSLSGSFTVNNDTGSFNKTVAADGVVEDGEAFVVEIRENSITGNILDTTSSVYIQGAQATGVGEVIDGNGSPSFHDFGSGGSLILDGSGTRSYTAATNVKLKAFIWGQAGGYAYGGLGGYSYGTFNLNQGDTLHMVLNYGGGPTRPGSGSGLNRGENGGGLAGIFSSSTISQANALLIAGGGGGGAPPVGGSGSAPGGNGGGPSGSGGGNSPDSTTGSTGGGGGSQSGGGGAGGGSGTGATPGSALQGGTGGQGSGSYPNWSGGGGGGAGYYGGGGGGGGDDYGSGTRAASGGGGGSGYVHSSVINGFTGGFASGQNHPERGGAGSLQYPSRIVLQGIIALEYRGTGGNEAYTVNVPATSTSMTAKVWGAGGTGIGECPPNGVGLDGGNFSGGSGGHVEGTIAVTGGDTVVVYVGGAGVGSPTGMSGSGAGRGGGYSGVKYGSNFMLAGGGGGAGQASNGGYGGGNGPGGAGTGGYGAPTVGQGGTQSAGGIAGSTSGAAASAGLPWSSPHASNNAYYRNSGGASGGAGTYQGKRGGGGGAGYYGGGGGGGFEPISCSGGGGGGGSGIINGSWTSTVSQNGLTGTGGGRPAVDTGDEHYVSGYGGSSQNGLVILIFE